jgi:hypothetical protein
MATKKKTKVEETKAKKPAKKKDSITLEMPGTIGSAKIVLPKEKKTKLKNVASGGWPKIQQGTHLTVKTFEDGKTELIWDWDALVSEVRSACLKAESNIPATIEIPAEVKPKRKKSKTK